MVVAIVVGVFGFMLDSGCCCRAVVIAVGGTF